MNNFRKTFLTSVALLLGSLLMNGLAVAQAVVEPVQVLGTVEVFCPTCALDMKFDDPERMGVDYEVLFEDLSSEPEPDFISCIRVPAGDFLCLDRSDKMLKKFPGTSSASVLDDVFSCEDDALDLNKRKSTTCTAYTFGLDAHFLAGQNNGRSFSLQRIFEEASCANQLDPILSPGLCAEEIYTGRPLLLDIKIVQDEVAENFLDYGPGVIGIEQRSDTSFFPVPKQAEPIVIATKKDWGLKGKQTLHSVDVLQITNPKTTNIDNYAVVTTSNDTILAIKIDIDGNSAPILAFNIASVSRPPMQCNFDEQHYGLKVDEKTDFAIVTDRNWCQAFALQPKLNDIPGDLMEGELIGFELVTETVAGSDPALILSTGPFDPIGPTTSPGKGFDLDDCTGDGCTFITGDEGANAATLQEVTIVPGPTGVTVFQAKGMPFCPYKPIACVELLDPKFDDEGQSIPSTLTRIEALDQLMVGDLDVLYRLPGTSSINEYRPEVFVFNATKVLPKEILDRFDDSGAPPNGIPPLWMLPDFRAQIQNNFFFEALFFVTEARTNDVLTMTLDIAELQGYPDSDLGCETAADLPPGLIEEDGGLRRLLAWDVTTRASERDPTVGGPQTPSEDDNFQGTIANAGCGSSRLRGGGLSMFAYNLEASGCPATILNAGQMNESLSFDTAGGVTCVLDDSGDAVDETPDDAVFAKAYFRYYDELWAHLQQFVCPILTPDDCVSLENSWLNGKDKLVKALDATIQPKVSAGAQNFGAVNSQFNNYLSRLAQIKLSVDPVDDPINRLGEHEARTETLQHIMDDKLIPSIPVNGFVESDTTWVE